MQEYANIRMDLWEIKNLIALGGNNEAAKEIMNWIEVKLGFIQPSLLKSVLEKEIKEVEETLTEVSRNLFLNSPGLTIF